MPAVQHMRNAWTTLPLIYHKLLIATVLLLYFYFGYMEAAGVNKHHPDPLYADVWLDHWIPQWPVFILCYMFGYVFVLTPMFVLQTQQACYRYAAVFWLLMTLSFVIFMCVPVVMDKQVAEGADWFSRLTRFQQHMDSRFNNLPSLHVSLNLLTFLTLRREHPRLGRWLAWVVPLVVASTLLVKQHLLIDCLTGIIAGLLAYRLYCWLMPAVASNGVSDA